MPPGTSSERHLVGGNDDGTVFEIAKTSGGYASTLTTLVSFNITNGAQPNAGLIMDAAGDLFGTTVSGGVPSFGTVSRSPRPRWLREYADHTSQIHWQRLAMRRKAA